MPRAPCVAVVGPPNSGKSTLLHWLDARLHCHPDASLAYVVAGSPDGVGRYLFHAPGLRTRLKAAVKGRWCEATVPALAGWIDAARERLELVLLDLGGRHAPGNAVLYERCTHAIVLAKPQADPASEEREGLDSWERDTAGHGLATLARLRSLGGDGEASVRRAADGVIEGVFLGEHGAPGDSTNVPVVDAIVGALMALRWTRSQPTYVDLNLRRRWTTADLADLGGRVGRIQEDSRRAGTVFLGGANAPIYAYARALHLAIDAHAEARVSVFDPKTPSGWVDIPEAPQRVGVAEGVRLTWVSRPHGTSLLVEITSPDRILPAAVCLEPGRLPVPPSPLPPGLLCTDGRGPIWLHLAYQRWIRRLSPQSELAVWDAGETAAVMVHGRRAGLRVEWPSAALDAGREAAR